METLVEVMVVEIIVLYGRWIWLVLFSANIFVDFGSMVMVVLSRIHSRLL